MPAVALPGDPLRGRSAYWHLVLSGEPALPAVRRGLRSSNPRIRELCTQSLDHL